VRIRKHLSPKNLFLAVRKKFEKIEDPSKRASSNKIQLVESLMSGLAVFSLKFPSLLQFEEGKSTFRMKRNLSSLYGVLEAPSDTHMRRQLDEVDPIKIRPAFNRVFSLLQRGKVLEEYQYLEGHYLLSIDGTGQYSSDQIHCEECCEKHHKKGRVEYYHQMLGASIVYPGNPIVIPLAPEPITKQDGASKNDCERNAAKRLLENMRREHPHLKLIVVEDALSSNGPHIELLQRLDMRFILGVKPDGNKYLFDWVNLAKCETHEEIDEKGVIHRFKFLNQVPLNDTYYNLKVNFLEYWEIHPNGKTQHFSWITDFLLTKENVKKIMKGGRARWKIENETFNTLKNQGYHFEHNFGHGNKHLCSVFTMLMLLSFLIDQVLELCSTLYKAARRREKRKYSLWEKMRTLFQFVEWNSWEDFLTAIITREVPFLNTA
jgi:hypothetical protein